MSQQVATQPNRAAVSLERIIEAFKTSEFPAMVKLAYINVDGKPSDKWSITNRVIMMLSGTRDARGYRQWESVGRYVKRGTKAFYIVKVRTKKITETVDGKDVERVITTGLHGIPVFRLEDTDGKPLKKPEPRELPPLLDVAKKWGVSVEYENSSHGEYGSFSPGFNHITLSTESPDVFFHELAHKAHSKFETLKGGQNPKQEAVAQLSACVLASLYGYDNMAWSWQYIAGYAGKKTPEAVGRLCMSVLAKVEKVLELILSEKAAIDETKGQT